MKTIFVTGGCGFIGSNFILQEIALGNRVINLDKLTYAANPENLTSIEGHKNYTFIKGDICDRDVVSRIFSEYDIDWLVNFAAESHVDNSISMPDEFIQTNVLGVFNLLEAVRDIYFDKADLKLLHVSTDEVFGSLKFDEAAKFNEHRAYEPSSPYSASKASGDHLAKAWYKTYGLPVIVTNCSNNFGPRQHREKLIPKIILSCLNEQKIPIYGNGNNIRDWIFVDDHNRGIKLALENGTAGESYCFGGNAEKSNNEIANLICNRMDELRPRRSGSYKELIEYVTDRKGHDLRYAIDDKKAKADLGFTQSKTFNERINETIDWYLKNESK